MNLIRLFHVISVFTRLAPSLVLLALTTQGHLLAEEAEPEIWVISQTDNAMVVEYDINPRDYLSETYQQIYESTDMRLMVLVPDGSIIQVANAGSLNSRIIGRTTYDLPQTPIDGTYDHYLEFDRNDDEEAGRQWIAIEEPFGSPWGGISYDTTRLRAFAQEGETLKLSGGAGYISASLFADEGARLEVSELKVTADGSDYSADVTISGVGTTILSAVEIDAEMESRVQHLEINGGSIFKFSQIKTVDLNNPGPTSTVISNCVFGIPHISAGESAGSCSISADELVFQDNYVNGYALLRGEETCDVLRNDFYPYQTDLDVDQNSGGVTVQSDLESLNFIGNACAVYTSFDITDLKDEDLLPVRGNSFLAGISVPDESIRNLKMPQNYWGGPGIPSSKHLFLDGRVSFRKSGPERITGHSVNTPIAGITVVGYHYGQHVLGGYGTGSSSNAYLRRENKVLVHAEVGMLYGTAPGNSCYLEIGGQTYHADNAGMTIKRDYGPQNNSGAPKGWLRFIIDPPASGLISGEIKCEQNGREYKLANVTMGFHSGPARPLRIGIMPVMVPGYPDFFDYSSNVATNAANVIRRDIHAMLPLLKDEVDIQVFPQAEYKMGYLALLSLLSKTSLLNELSSFLTRHLDVINSKLNEPLDYLVVPLPRDLLGLGNEGVSMPFRRQIIFINEINPDAFLHELGHTFGLYTVKEQYTVFDEGYDGYGNYWVDGKGIRVEGVTAYIPTPGISHPRVPGGIRYFPVGNNLNHYDIMGGSANQWIIPDTYNKMCAGLFSLLGTKGESNSLQFSKLSAPDNGTIKSGRQASAPAAGTRRIIGQAFIDRDDEFKEYPVRPTLAFGIAPPDTDPVLQADSSALRLTAQNADGNEVFSGNIRTGSTPGGLLPSWFQTFDIPQEATRFEIYNSYTTTRYYDVHEAFNSLSISLSSTVLGEGNTVKLEWDTVYDSPAGHLPLAYIEYSLDQGATWSTHNFATPQGKILAQALDLGSPPSIKFRAAASDGFTTVYSDETGPFNMSGSSLDSGIEIISPWDGAVSKVQDDWILLAGISGPLVENVSIEWSSNLDGALGTGATLNQAGQLTAGSHQITCTYKQGDTVLATDQVSVEVLADDYSGALNADLEIPESALTVSLNGVEPNFGSHEKPFLNTPTTATVSLRNPGTGGVIEYALYAIAPDSSETILAEDSVYWTPLQAHSFSGSWTPTQPGNHSLRVEVDWLDEEEAPVDSDLGNNTRTWTFSNEAPVAYDSFGVTDIKTPANLYIRASDPDGDSVVFTLVDEPDHGSLDTTGAMWTYTPDGNFIGEDTFSFSASDGINPAVVATGTVHIVASKPIITSPNTWTGEENAYSEYQITTDDPNSIILYGGKYLWSGCSVNPDTGLVSGSFQGFGQGFSTVTAENAVGRQEHEIEITITEDTGLPKFTSEALATGRAGENFSHSVVADHQTTSYTFGDLPPGLFYNEASGLISGTPTVSGTYVIRVGAINDNGTSWQDLTLIIAPTKQPPWVSAFTTMFANQGTAFDQSIAADYDPFHFSVNPLPVGLELDEATGHITGTPLESGQIWSTVEVTNINGTTTADLIFEITPLAGAPVVSVDGPLGLGNGEQVSYQISASNSPTSYMAEGLPTGISVNANTGLITGSSTEAGTYEVILYASNASGTGGKRMMLDVYIDFYLPYIYPDWTNGSIGSAFDYLVDPAGSPTGINLISDLPKGIQWNTSTRRLSGVPESIGTSMVEFEVSNANGTTVCPLQISVSGNPAGWMAVHGLVDLTSDPDKDGLGSLMEFALGTDPKEATSLDALALATNPSSASSLSWRMPAGGTGSLFYGYEVNGVRFHIEQFNPDTGQWDKELIGISSSIQVKEVDGWIQIEAPIDGATPSGLPTLLFRLCVSEIENSNSGG